MVFSLLFNHYLGTQRHLVPLTHPAVAAAAATSRPRYKAWWKQNMLPGGNRKMWKSHRFGKEMICNGWFSRINVYRRLLETVPGNLSLKSGFGLHPAFSYPASVLLKTTKDRQVIHHYFCRILLSRLLIVQQIKIQINICWQRKSIQYYI